MNNSLEQLISLQQLLQANAQDPKALEELAACLNDATCVQNLSDEPQAATTLAAIAQEVPSLRLIWQTLATMYRKQGKAQEAAHALQQDINLLPNNDERRNLLLELAAFLAVQLHDIKGSMVALQSVLADDNKNPAAIALLEQLILKNTDAGLSYELTRLLVGALKTAEAWQPLVEALQNRAVNTHDIDEKSYCLLEIAHLLLQKLNDQASAYSYLEQVFVLKPQDQELRLELEACAAATNQWSTLAQAYASQVSQTADLALQKILRLRLAEILDKHLQRPAEALEQLQELLGNTLPDDVASLEVLEGLLRKTGGNKQLVPVLTALLPRMGNQLPERRFALWLELAHLYETQEKDIPQAVHALTQALEINPKHIESLQALVRLLETQQDWPMVVTTLDRLVDLASTNPNLLTDMLHRAEILAQMGKSAEALAGFQAVLLKKRDHPAALLGIEQLLNDATVQATVIQILEPIYTARQDHAKLAVLLEKKVSLVTDLAARKSLWRRIGDIYENRLSDKPHALLIARGSLAEDPADMGVRMWLEKIAAETQAWHELVAIYVEEAKKAPLPLNIQFFRRAAALFNDKLQDVSGAVHQYQAILALDPRDETALSGLEQLFRAHEEYAELVNILKSRITTSTGLERKRDLLNEIATLQAEKLGDLTLAVATSRELLQLIPDDLGAFARLEGYLKELSLWNDLINLYASEMSRLSAKRGREAVSRRLQLMFYRGQVLDEQFGDAVQARQFFSDILQEEPEHAMTIQYLKKRAAAGSTEATLQLEQVYRQSHAYPHLIDLLNQKLEQTAETQLRCSIYLQLADLFEQELKQGEEAFLAVSRAYHENRADLSLLERLEALATKFKLWEKLVEVLAGSVDVVTDPRLRRTLLHRLGDIYGNQLGRIDDAIGYLRNALQYDPSDDEALAALDRLLEKNQMWAALADILERRVEIATETSIKSRLLERLAIVLGDRLMDAEAALRCNKQILDIDPEHPLTLKSMQKLYAEVQDYDSLAQNLQKQLKVHQDPTELLRVHVEAAYLYTDELSDNNQAIVHWQAVLALQPQHALAHKALEVLLSSEERWEDLAQLYREQLAFSPDQAQKLDINQRLGMILGQKLGRSDDALLSWQRVLEQDAKHVEALRALLLLYSERAKWQEYVTTARQLIPLVDVAEAKETRLALAQVLGENLGLRDEAIRLAREVRSIEPHTVDQLSRLATMLVHIEAFEEAATTFEKAGALQNDVFKKVALYERAAGLYRESLQKPNLARTAYEAILAVQPGNEQAHAALAEIYRQLGEWRRLVVLHESFLQVAPQPMHIVLLTEIRNIHQTHLNEKDLAFIAACRVYKENPNDIAATDILENLAVQSQSVEELTSILEDELENIVDKEIKIAGLRRLARLYIKPLDDVPHAEQTLGKILQLQPNDVAALDDLIALGNQTERFDKTIDALERKLKHVDAEVFDKKALLREIARVWEYNIGEPDEAIDAFERLLQLDSNDDTALTELARIHQAEGCWLALIGILQRKIDLTTDIDANIQLHMQVASLCGNELKDPETAIQWYQRILLLAKDYLPALEALSRLYTSFARWSELIVVLETQISQTTDVPIKISLYSKMAVVHEQQFGGIKDAVACFEHCFKLDHTHIVSLKELERLLRVLSEWERLVEVLQHHATLLADKSMKTELYLEIGDIYYKELARVDKAENIYSLARETSPNNLVALHALGTLYERSGNWFQALEVLQREIDLRGRTPEVLGLLNRIGHIQSDILSDNSAAQVAYTQALAIDPNDTAALVALKQIAKESGDWDHYSEHLIAQAEVSDDLEQKAELFNEAAKFFLQTRQDDQSAIRYYQRSLQVMPNHLDSSRSLADLYFQNEQWSLAQGLYETVLKSIDKMQDPRDFCQKYYRLAYSSDKLGQADLALRYYRLAFEADSSYLPALEGLCQALLQAKLWDEAQRVLQTMLIHHRNSLTEAEIVDVQWQLGELYIQQAQPDRAYTQYEKALDINPDHAPSLRAMADLEKQQGRWPEAYKRLSRLADATTGTERIGILTDMSQLAESKLHDQALVIEPLERARRTGDMSLPILEKLGSAYSQNGQAVKAVDVLEQAVTLCQDANQLAELNYTLGQIYETTLQNEPMAVQRYNDALNALPTYFKAFECIERLLGQRREWALLEANYRAMLARAKDFSVSIRVVLWRNLGDLYRFALRHVDNAIMAFEVLHKLQPEQAEYITILADLYGQKPQSRDKAISMQHDLLPTLENPVAAIRSLHKYYRAERDFDAVFMLCSALVFLKEADEEEHKLFDYLQRGLPAKASRGLTEDQWKSFIEPVFNEPIATLAATLYRASPDFVTSPAKDLGLRKKDQIDVQQSELYFASMVRYVGHVLTLPMVDVYRKSGSMESLRLAPAQPLALVAGESNTIFRDMAQRVVLFHVARNMACTRPELFLAHAYPGTELRDLLYGLCMIYNRTLSHTGDAQEVERWATLFEKLPSQVLKRLQAPAQAAYPLLHTPEALLQYSTAVETVAIRAGLLACGDLAAAARGVSEMSESAGSLSVRDRIRDLVLFAVSRPHLQIRKLIGSALIEQKS